jgi:predicted RNA binding protein YcfA (HicA-like mRNA interferase family)
MTSWPSAKARQVLAALQRIGWEVKRSSGSRRTLARPGWSDFVYSFHENEEIGPKMQNALTHCTTDRLTAK